MLKRDISVIRLMDADIDDVSSIRALLSDALSVPAPRVLADLSGLGELGGSMIAAMIIASRELGADGRFAVYAPEHIYKQLVSWGIVDSWSCFGEWEHATAFLCEDAG
ncbi:MAG: hypothetical protein CVT66_09200 [Actinobacteria bacterium HGW-Actinobacteria-6]|jgi:hypothetical protein|nr:MAG: hypothetical protein CVT66_09200 [Actinobacteria bacterium HGW-Actinobacteria-6]